MEPRLARSAAMGPEPDEARAVRAQTVGTAATAAVGLGALLLAGRTVGVVAPPCPFRAATGVPCPFCGITRLADGIAHLRVDDALAASPAGVLIVVGLAVVAATALAARARHRPLPSWVGSPRLVPAALVVLALHWATSIAFGLPT